MSQPRIRPVFDVPVAVDLDRVFALLDKHIGARDSEVRGWVHDRHGEFHLEADPRFFSPALHVSAVEGANGHALRCRFAPLPQVWVVFVGIHFIVALGGLSALVYGAVQLFLSQPPWAFALVPIAPLLSAFVAGAAFIGQGLAGEEMHKLRTFVERTVADASSGG